MLLWIIIVKKDPGYLNQDKGLDLVEDLLEKFEPSSLCPECVVIRTPRCRHCPLCQKCVDRYDHHCPWVNNCIGKSNFAYFYLFVLVQTFYLATVVWLSVYCKSNSTNL
jgi:palmitoyltransferase ZDHHC13/17